MSQYYLYVIYNHNEVIDVFNHLRECYKRNEILIKFIYINKYYLDKEQFGRDCRVYKFHGYIVFNDIMSEKDIYELFPSELSKLKLFPADDNHLYNIKLITCDGKSFNPVMNLLVLGNIETLV